MKTKEELNAIRENVETLNKKLNIVVPLSRPLIKQI